jgi:hypothetical protein
MRPIGLSTGALAYEDFRRGLAITRTAGCAAVELSALRQPELLPLLDSLASLALAGFEYISIHTPRQFEPACDANTSAPPAPTTFTRPASSSRHGRLWHVPA